MPVDQPEFECRHFSLANARDDRPSDLPICSGAWQTRWTSVRSSPMDVLDLTISQEMTEDGPWWSATVYWSTDVDE